MRKLVWAQTMAAVLAAMAPARAASATELRMCLRAEPRTLNPAMASDDASDTIKYLTSGVLIRVNRKTGDLMGELAERWEVARDGRSIRFWLRRGVVFSDGTPFTAADVAHTMSVVMDPKTKAPIADSFRSSSGPVRTFAEAPLTARIEFAAPVSGLAGLFDQVAVMSASSPIKERAVLGPYEIAEHKPGSHLVLTRNPRYWKRDSKGRQLPSIGRIRLEIQSNRELEMMKFGRGELETVTGLDPELFERLQRQGDQRAKDLGAGFDVEMVWLNQSAKAPLPLHKKAWFASAAFRRALSEAIARQDLARVVFRGHATPASGPVPETGTTWRNSSIRPQRHDPGSAARRLASEGFRRRGEWLEDAAGNRVEFSVITNAGNRTRERMAAMIQQDLKAIGVKLNVVAMDFPALIERITRTMDYEACLLGYVNVEPDPNSQMNIWLSSAPQHAWNPLQEKPATPWETEMDRLMRAQSASSNEAERKRIFDQVQQIIFDQTPMIFLVNKNVLVAWSPRLRNVAPSRLRPQLLWNVEWLEMAPGAGR